MEEDEMGNERVREIITGARLKCEEENNKKNREILGNVKLCQFWIFAGGLKQRFSENVFKAKRLQ